jgi:hypothetical protein
VVDRNANTLYIYFDGVEKNTFDISGWTDTFDNGYPVYYGANYNKGGTADCYFKGNLDEIAIFNAKLDTDDVAYIYNDGITNDLSTIDSLVSWHRMGQ